MLKFNNNLKHTKKQFCKYLYIPDKCMECGFHFYSRLYLFFWERERENTSGVRGRGTSRPVAAQGAGCGSRSHSSESVT